MSRIFSAKSLWKRVSGSYKSQTWTKFPGDSTDILFYHLSFSILLQCPEITGYVVLSETDHYLYTRVRFLHETDLISSCNFPEWQKQPCLSLWDKLKALQIKLITLPKYFASSTIHHISAPTSPLRVDIKFLRLLLFYGYQKVLSKLFLPVLLKIYPRNKIRVHLFCN